MLFFDEHRLKFVTVWQLEELGGQSDSREHATMVNIMRRVHLLLRIRNQAVFVR